MYFILVVRQGATINSALLRRALHLLLFGRECNICEDRVIAQGVRAIVRDAGS